MKSDNPRTTRLLPPTLIAAGAILFAFTVLVPPWNRLHLEMQEMLYGMSREASVMEVKPAGHLPWFMVPEAVEIGRNTVGNFYRFERIEYRIDWFDLAWQWSAAAILIGSGLILAMKQRRSIQAAGNLQGTATKA